VISLILYGRNDAHGYNLHRRAALSLNCLAEVLTHPDDEIVFVDYNTPDELPTFVEAISDTLTTRCLDRLRVLRVRASVHRERYGPQTHLPVVEPVARNAAVRRSNPANRWLLSTNTDMVLIPPCDQSLSDVCGGIADAFYGLPRFELPEWLWETLPRTRPEDSIEELRRLGPRLRLDEHTFSDAWIRFDAPGDFQLCLREDFVAIDGFNEEMLLGWHVDSNLSKRLALHRGSIDSLDQLAGYHCNHNRTPTVYHEAAGIGNDLDRFFVAVKQSTLPDQAASWGLSEDVVEEISVRGDAAVSLVNALSAAIPPAESERIVSSTQSLAFDLTYDSGHVLPFVADSIALSPAGTTIGYLGANPTLARMLEVLAFELDRSLKVVVANDDPSALDIAAAADIFVLDFGLDSGDAAAEGALRMDTHTRVLRSLLAGLEQIVAEERARLERGAHRRRFVLVNSTTLYTNGYVARQFDYSLSTPHSRVRRATVKLVPLTSTKPDSDANVERLLRWGQRSGDDRHPLPLRVGRTVELAELDDFRGFGAGWAYPEPTAIWTRGRRAEVGFSVDPTSRGRYVLAILIGRIGAGRDESLEVDMLIDGSRVDTCRFPGGPHALTWSVALPAEAQAAGSFELTFEIHPPRIWRTDSRELGLHVRAFRLRRDDWRRRIGEVVAGLRLSRS